MSLISVIVPIYNVDKYLRRCVESIINQTYKNLEIILVNDGSLDNCGKICDEYAQKDVRVKVVHKNNGGLSDARNAGLDIATGEYIGFVDSDDSIELDMYEELYNNIKENNCDLAICGIRTISEFGTVDICINDNNIVMNNDELMEKFINTSLVGSAACNKLYDVSLFLNRRFSFGIIHEDADIMYKIIYDVKRAVYIGTSKYNYYKRDSSISNSKYTLKKDVLNNITDEKYYYLKEKYPYLEKKLYDDRVEVRIVLIKFIIRTGEFESYKEIIYEMQDFLRKHKPYGRKLNRKRILYTKFFSLEKILIVMERNIKENLKKIFRSIRVG